MNKQQLILVILLTLISNIAIASQTIQAKVNGMVCAFCAQGIEKKMRALSQTQDVYVNLKQRLVAVELKNGQTIANDKIKAIIKDAGYDVVSIELSETPVAHIKAQSEAKQESK